MPDRERNEKGQFVPKGWDGADTGTGDEAAAPEDQQAAPVYVMRRVRGRAVMVEVQNGET